MARQSDREQDRDSGGTNGVLDGLPTDELKDQAREFVAALGERAAAVMTDKIGDLSERLTSGGNGGGLLSGMVGGALGGGGDGNGNGGNGGGPVKHLLAAGASGVKEKIMDKVGGGGNGGGGSGGKKDKVTTIIEQIEVGVPVRVAYNQWTQFQDYPKFTKRIENVDQKADEKVTWKAAIYFSHRTWESTIVEQIPDEHIVWHSQGDKGYIDGTVTFHETAPNLTKILLVLEYHPQGLFEKTGNAFRSQRRRARLELHQFDRHVMRQTILEQDEVEGWRGEIRDGEVVRSHEDAMEKEQNEQDQDEENQDEENQDEENQDEEDEQDQDESPDDEYEDEYDDEYENEAEEDEEPGDEEPGEEDDEQDEYEDEYEDEEPEDEESEEDEEEPEDDERAPARRRRREPAMSR